MFSDLLNFFFEINVLKLDATSNIKDELRKKISKKLKVKMFRAFLRIFWPRKFIKIFQVFVQQEEKYFFGCNAITRCDR